MITLSALATLYSMYLHLIASPSDTDFGQSIASKWLNFMSSNFCMGGDSRSLVAPRTDKRINILDYLRLVVIFAAILSCVLRSSTLVS